MTRPAAFRFLCACLAADGGADPRAALAPLVAAGETAWQDLVWLASAHQVTTALGPVLRDKGLADLLPADVAGYFNGMATLNRQRNARVRDEAAELAGLLNGAGVAPVFLKGGANLLDGLYADPAIRVMVDLDVLVPAGDAERCYDLLRGQGFEVLQDEVDPRGHQHPALGRPGAAVSVEVHRDVLPYPYGDVLPGGQVLDAAIAIDLDGARAAIPAPRHRVVHNIAHAQLADHGYLYGLLELRRLFDFVLLRRAFDDGLDWREIAGRFAGQGTATALGYHLEAAHRLLGAPSPAALRPNAAARMLCSRAEKLIVQPRRRDRAIRLLRPWLLLKRALRDRDLRRRLARNLADPAWHRRHWRDLLGR